ncbi:MAG: zinc ribbon domain-containing protein [Desulfobulbaceae bacterium]|nr:zinc ribbon domain-containing protein [Desulfobulbaceae bacterium]HIJ79084.1 zinc ribbon domain-containing protein [Deltaproteobacteria bacterium]
MDIERCIKLASEEHYCPHCQQRLSCCEAPPFHVGDGLGWGSDIFFICLNDECSLFTKSWDEFEERYGHSASCRYMLLPGEKKGSPMMVGSTIAFTGSIIDVETLTKQGQRYECQKKYTEQLETCVAENNLQPALCLVIDDLADLDARKRACDLLVDINSLDCIDPIRNHKFIHGEIRMKAEMAVKQLLSNNHKQECPFCMEIIKSQAKICMHCGKDI